MLFVQTSTAERLQRLICTRKRTKQRSSCLVLYSVCESTSSSKLPKTLLSGDCNAVQGLLCQEGRVWCHKHIWR